MKSAAGKRGHHENGKQANNHLADCHTTNNKAFHSD
jgi:hypothetical protein